MFEIFILKCDFLVCFLLLSDIVFLQSHHVNYHVAWHSLLVFSLKVLPFLPSAKTRCLISMSSIICLLCSLSDLATLIGVTGGRGLFVLRVFRRSISEALIRPAVWLQPASRGNSRNPRVVFLENTGRCLNSHISCSLA